MTIIKWITAKLYPESGGVNCTATGHIFECMGERIVFRKFQKGYYPPFNCLELDTDEAIELRDFLNKVINKTEVKNDVRRT